VNLNLITALKALAKQVACEKFGSYDFGPYGGTQKSCYMKSRTSVDSPDTTISSASDTSVGGIILDSNKQIRFLPFEIYKSYPNLIVLNAHHCSIKAISNDNFKNLKHLRHIGMESNPITIIPSDVFKGLESLEFLDFCEIFEISLDSSGLI